MKRVNVFLAILLLLASACTATPSPDATVILEPTAKPTATPTITPTATKTPTPEPTSTPTETPTPEPTSTPTETPTPTPFPESAFSIEVVGYHEHGAMYELHYDGDWSDLDEVTIRLSAEQDGERKDSNQTFEVIDERHLAEMTDAMYHLGGIDVLLNVQQGNNSLAGTTRIEFSAEFSQWYPFMKWLFGESDLGGLVNFPNPKHPEAYDLQPTSDNYPDGAEHPVLSPCVGEVYQSSTLPRDDGKTYHNMWIYCPYTGFYIQAGHMYPQLPVGSNVDTDTVIGYLSDEVAPFYHNHITIRRPTTAPRKSQITDNSTFVDIFNPHIQLGGAELPYGFWLPDTLPPRVKELIEENFFAADYETSRYMVTIP